MNGRTWLLRSTAITAIALVLFVSVLQPGRAESPFLIEDPSTLPAGRWESFSSFERYVNSHGGTSYFPQAELHDGLREDLLLHIDLPYEENVQDSSPRATGFGDLGFGLKYRFMNGRGEGLTAAFFPQMTLPVGNARTGLGSGKPTYELPVWVQRTTGASTICVGGGLSLNPVPGGRTSIFAGILAHRDFGSRWMVGTEIIAKGAESQDDLASTTFDVGATYHWTPNVGILARVGRTVAGLRTDNIYIGIYLAGGASPDRN